MSMQNLDTFKDPTIIEHLYALPEEYRSKALHYVFLNGRLDLLAINRVQNPKQALAAAFDFWATKEGVAYWLGVQDSIGNGQALVYLEPPKTST